MIFVRSKFKQAFVPTLLLLTDLCGKEDKYSWEEVKAELQGIMQEMGVDVTWVECEERLERYMKKIMPLMNLQ